MDFNNDWHQVQTDYQSYLSSVRDKLVGDARSLLKRSLDDRRRHAPGVPGDAYMYHANAIGLAAAQSGMTSTAAEIYKTLISDVRELRTTTGEQLSIGLLLVNLGAVYFSQGHYDHGVFYFLEAARDDALVSGNPPEQSYALTNLMPEIVERSVLEKTLEAVQSLIPQMKQADIDAWYASLDNRRYAYLAYMRQMLDNRQLLIMHTHEYSYWQVFSALRNLSALFEVEIKLQAHKNSLFGALEGLYNQNAWWSLFLSKRTEVGESRGSTVPCETRLRKAFDIPTTTKESKFWKALLITYITRNYTVHEMNTPNVLVRKELDEVLMSVLYTLIAAPSFA